MNFLTFNGIVLEQICPVCQGIPKKVFSSSFFARLVGNYCQRCGGVGCIPTKDGEAICMMIKTYFITDGGFMARYNG